MSVTTHKSMDTVVQLFGKPLSQVDKSFALHEVNAQKIAKTSGQNAGAQPKQDGQEFKRYAK